MYIEVIHDANGKIEHCYCTDTLPVDSGVKLFEVRGNLTPGYEQARINIDTLTAMEIDTASGQKAVIDPVTGQPKIIRVDRCEYIMNTFDIDMTAEITPPAGVQIPEGLKMKSLVRK